MYLTLFRGRSWRDVSVSSQVVLYSWETVRVLVLYALYTSARERHPARWSGNTRNWSPIGAVTLNPERDSVVATHERVNDSQAVAA